MLLAQWCSEILNRSNCAGALHWSDIFVRGSESQLRLRTQEIISELPAQGPERVEQEASEIIRKLTPTEHISLSPFFFSGHAEAHTLPAYPLFYASMVASLRLIAKLGAERIVTPYS